MMAEATLEILASEARDGNRASLEALVARIQPRIHSLAVRMLWHPDDAADATQDILVRIITHLASFRGDSAFLTWVLRIAANHLLTCRRSRLEREGLSFATFAADLAEGLSGAPPSWSPENAVLLEEVKVGCMLGMLQGLDRNHRLAYLLGDVLECDGPEAAEILQVSPQTFRQRLSRARRTLIAFTRAHCGLMDRNNACHCARRVKTAINRGRVDPNAPRFANAEKARGFPAVLEMVEAFDEERRLAMLYRTASEPPVAEALVRLDAILTSRDVPARPS